MKKFATWLLCAWSFNSVALATSIAVKGETVRGIKNYFTTTVTIKDLPAADLGALTEQQYIEANVYVLLESYDNLKVPFTTPEDDAVAVFDEVISHDVEDSKHDIVATVQIHSNKTIDLFKDSSGDIFIGACIREKDGTTISTSCEEDVENQKVAFLNLVVNDAPQNFKGISRHLQAGFEWQVKKNPTFINSDDVQSTRPATGQVVILVKPGAGVGTLPALTYLGGDREDDTSTTCSIDDDAANGSACVDCGSSGKVYLDIEAIKNSQDAKSGNIVVASLDASETEVAFSKLKEGMRYVAFATYLPDALKRSACYSATPYRGRSWTELNGGDEAKTGVPCVIATAAYGTSMAEEIDHLRWFRNKYLMPYPVGQQAVKFYYEYGPYAANYISQSDDRRAMTRVVLWPVVKFVQAWRWTIGEYPYPQITEK